jgi:alpha-L-fucosidase
MTSGHGPSWRALGTHVTPQWFRDAKFGIYTHWGVYCVPACGKNATWYPYYMYREGNPQYDHHMKTYGGPAKFGYKDFIPMFEAEKFDPDEWAELFKKAGARFAGPVGEHHDGFAMWDSKLTEWNAAKMGPKRDVVGELERAIRGQNMRFLIALHHAENWWFYPHWEAELDVSDPRYAGLYGPNHNQEWARGIPASETRDGEWELQDKPSKDYLDRWAAKTREVVDKYRPDMLWFDNGLRLIQEQYKREMLAYYYDRATEWGKGVVVTYKHHDLAPGAGVADLELGRMGELTYNEWITDTSVDDQGAWGYVQDAGVKPVTALVHNLVDNVSKNGYMLLNVGPKPNGEIPEPAKECLLGIGKWLEVNGEAIFDTTPWMIYGEGPTQMKRTGHFSERDEVDYTAKDIRITAKDNVLYATCLGWPVSEVTIESFKTLYPSEIRSVEMLGVDAKLEWSLTGDGLKVKPPSDRPCEHAYVFKITRGHPF